MPATFKTKLLKFGECGDKTGWTYVLIDKACAKKLKDTKKSFRVKGFLDNFPVEQAAVMPMGDGNFILAFNAAMRKGTGKAAGDFIQVTLEEDTQKLRISSDLSECLENETEARTFFNTLNPSNQRYFSKWIESAKTADTKTKRIILTIEALLRKINYPQMLREQTAKNRDKK